MTFNNEDKMILRVWDEKMDKIEFMNLPDSKISDHTNCSSMLARFLINKALFPNFADAEFMEWFNKRVWNGYTGDKEIYDSLGAKFQEQISYVIAFPESVN